MAPRAGRGRGRGGRKPNITPVPTPDQEEFNFDDLSDASDHDTNQGLSLLHYSLCIAYALTYRPTSAQ